MKISTNWLREYIETPLDADEIADKLTLLGLEVEGIEKIGSDFEGIVVGEILEVKAHPNADRLQLCEVNLGNEQVQIVCGAKNVAKGQKVPVAVVGATLPTPLPDGGELTIRKAKLRGEPSEGMICSEVELGIGDDHTGIMVLNESLKTGSPFKETINTKPDYILEIGLTPNRPDAACHIGVARDLAAVVEGELKNPYQEVEKSAEDLSDHIKVNIEDTVKCHRYVGMMVENVTVSESPEWLKNRLKSIGLRPVNNVVDVTNFILHEIGQPLHAFDYDKIAGKKINVKSFDQEITFKTLDDLDRKVPANTLFICDGDGPVAVAGVMGGKGSEVSNQTKTVFIESAYFDPTSVRKASKALTLQTDSSYRFERGIDPTLQLRAAKRAADLIAELSGGRVIDQQTDVHPVKTDQKVVSLRPSRVNHLLGTDLGKDEVTGILTRLEFDVAEKSDDELSCSVPFFRPDVSREVDLIEEVGRVFDYNNIPTPKTSPFFTPEKLSDWEVFNERVRSLAKSLSYKEITTNSLLSKKEASLLADENIQIDTLNPVSQENTTLRTHLLAGFLKAARYNFNRNAKQLRFFELGHVFQQDEKGTWIDGVKEHSHLLFGLSGYKKFESWDGKPESFTIFDIKADVEAFFRELDVHEDIEQVVQNNYELEYQLDGNTVATIKMIDDYTLKGFDLEEEAFSAEIDVTVLYNFGLAGREIEYKKVSKYPSFEFDAAFIVDSDVRAGDLSKEIQRSADDTLVSVDVFDVYEGKNLGSNKKSIAFRLSFLDSNKTLTIKDVEPMVKKIVQALESKFEAKLRS